MSSLIQSEALYEYISPRQAEIRAIMAVFVIACLESIVTSAPKPDTVLGQVVVGPQFHGAPETVAPLRPELEVSNLLVALHRYLKRMRLAIGCLGGHHEPKYSLTTWFGSLISRPSVVLKSRLGWFKRSEPV